MGGVGSGRKPDPLKSIGQPPQTPIAAQGSEGIYVPNYSGAATAVEDEFIKKGGDTYSGDYTNTDGDLNLTKGDINLTNGDFETSDGRLLVTNVNASTSTSTNIVELERNTSGTPANNIGLGIRFRIETSTTEGQQAALWTCTWDDVTHATRTSKMLYQMVDSGSTVSPLVLLGNTMGVRNTNPDSNYAIDCTGDINCQDVVATSLTMATGDIVSAGDATFSGDVECDNLNVTNRVDIDAESGQNTPTIEVGKGTVNNANQYMEHKFFFSDTIVTSATKNVYTMSNDEAVMMEVSTVGIKIDGSLAYSGKKIATFKKDGGAGAVEVGSETTVHSEITDRAVSLTLSESSNVLSYGINMGASGETWYFTTKVKILSSI